VVSSREVLQVALQDVVDDSPVQLDEAAFRRGAGRWPEAELERTPRDGPKRMLDEVRVGAALDQRAAERGTRHTAAGCRGRSILDRHEHLLEPRVVTVVRAGVARELAAIVAAQRARIARE